MKPAKVSYAAKDGYDKELDKLLETGKIVDGVNLIVASQIVPVLKMKDNEIKVRNTINFKPTINPQIEDEPYNFPTIEEAVDKLNGEYFTCLDIKDAYPHFELEEESQKYLTISTDRGFIQPTRLPQGVKTAPKIFQSYMDKLLAGMNEALDNKLKPAINKILDSKLKPTMDELLDRKLQPMQRQMDKVENMLSRLDSVEKTTNENSDAIRVLQQ